MKQLKLSDNTRIPVICYGSNIIDYNEKNLIKYYGKIIKKIFSFKIKELKRDFSIKRIIKEMKKEDISAIDTSRAYGASERLIGQSIKKCREKFYIITI